MEDAKHWIKTVRYALDGPICFQNAICIVEHRVDWVRGVAIFVSYPAENRGARLINPPFAGNAVAGLCLPFHVDRRSGPPIGVGGFSLDAEQNGYIR
jgi:hypothetical protein